MCGIGGDSGRRRGSISDVPGSTDAAGRSVRVARDVDQVDAQDDNASCAARRGAVAVQRRPQRTASRLPGHPAERLPVRALQVQFPLAVKRRAAGVLNLFLMFFSYAFSAFVTSRVYGVRAQITN